MINFAYITRVGIPSLAAQSVQIKSMSIAFNNVVDKFILISPLTSENSSLQESFLWSRIPCIFNGGKGLYIEFILKACIEIIKIKPRFIYTRDIGIAAIGVLLGIKTIYESHKQPFKAAHLIVKILTNSSLFSIVAISKSLESYINSKFNLKDGHLYSYHDGVFMKKYDSLRFQDKQQLKLQLKLPLNLLVMHTGSLYSGRGADLFLAIIDSFPDLTFVQVGGRVEDVRKWKEEYKSYNNIIFINHQDNDTLVKYQMCADLLFYPLTYEVSTWWCCSPMKIFEYMATGNPILASNIGSVGEVLDKSNAVIFNVNDVSTIIDGVNFYLNNPLKCKNMSLKSLKSVKTIYNWDKRALKILNFFNIT